ncbi:trypsin-like peptidase domain-containing protein [Massilia antarctica]|uniref:Trypsin-like peptidase domain-containing protein n=1 Tax=Massilia antarctica TaxID=2765360 RepID=A0AA49A7R3_9BURK|nr:serine protease [Massilia antarctica]QPI49698.1 trypsin-like peptidase domain-containing protein [Massilia antarctica]
MKFVNAAVLAYCFAAHAIAATAPAPPPAPRPPPAPLTIPAVIPPPAPAVIPPGAQPPATTPEVDDNAALPPPSSAAQKVYSAAKGDLLQIRMLLKNGRSQSTVGSGFMVGTSNLVLTNYHVVSQMALDPDVYVGEYIDTDGKSGPVELLAVDVLHDLAVVRINRNGSGFFNIPEKLVKLTQGQYLYSLGNPLDLGFAISEGSYNGIITRSFYDQLMFTGPINSGMSGGPSVTVAGDVAGVNVSKRRDGELISFLVPVRFAQELLKKVAAQTRTPKDFNPLIGQQLLAHQRGMIDRLLDAPLSLKTMGPYQVPVRESDQVRCWGRSNVKAEATFNADTMACAMESAIFVSDSQQTGHVSMTHQYVRSAILDPVRFAVLASTLFKTDNLGSTKDTRLTGPMCTEKFVKTTSLPLRAVTCVRAYRKFAGLYNFTLLTASTDDARATLQSRLDVSGVSYENGLRTTRAFLEALARGNKP